MFFHFSSKSLIWWNDPLFIYWIGMQQTGFFCPSSIIKFHIQFHSQEITGKCRLEMSLKGTKNTFLSGEFPSNFSDNEWMGWNDDLFISTFVFSLRQEEVVPLQSPAPKCVVRPIIKRFKKKDLYFFRNFCLFNVWVTSL